MLSPCPTCGTDIEEASLSCPGCGWLTRSSQLQSLANDAQAAARAGNPEATRDLWLQAAALLPQDTVQYRSIQARVTDLDSQIAASKPAPPSGIGRKIISTLAPAGLLLWKFKALLLGLTKIGTLLSMVAFFGVYWSLYGWPLALGIVLSIYIHEMGHVIELRSYGIPASAPMFIPGLGAFVRLKTANITPLQDSRIGLAGPIYGLGAALAALAVYLLTGWKVWAAIANFTAVINLFNLIPVWRILWTDRAVSDRSRSHNGSPCRRSGLVCGSSCVNRCFC